MRPTDPKSAAAVGAAICLGVLLVAVPASTQTMIGYPRVMQGPMIGAVTATEALIWVRTTGEYAVTIEYGTDLELTSVRSTEAVVAKKANDYTLILALTGLEPSTEYFYRVLVNGAPDRYIKRFTPLHFRTAPPRGAATDFRVAFGSCPQFQDDRFQPIWTVIAGLEPDLFFWIGDNVYADTLDPDIIREEYRRQRDVAGLQPLLHNVPNLAVWDDHDFGLNDHDRTNPIKKPSLEIFTQYWANPAYGLPETPGVFFTYSYGAVDFFFLDGRYYRDPNAEPDTPDKTMLGQAQFEWLRERLAASTAVFKVVVSGSGWTVAKGEGGDSWAAFRHERDRLFDFIRDEEISGVILVSGDSHVGELNVIPWSNRGGYDYYDLVSSPLAQEPSDSWLPNRPEGRIRPVYFQGSNVGVIDFFFDGEPRVMYRLFDFVGRNIWEPFVVRADELINGVCSWPSKVDDKETLRQDSYEAGQGCYEIDPK